MRMQEKEFELAGGSLYYEKCLDKIVITRFQGLASEVHIPEEIEGLPVREIGKKAFLSKKLLRKVLLPDTIEEIGDWAFAYCDGLEQVLLPDKGLRFGKAVFLECKSLAGLMILSGKTEDSSAVSNDMVGSTQAHAARECEPGNRGTWKMEAVAALLAAAVTSMEAYYLLDVEEAGGEEWLTKWDARMMELLGRPDEEGFSKQVLCGEEDYGSTDLNVFINEKRKGKVRLLLLRCLFPLGLSEEKKCTIQHYLQQHTKGCTSEETWQVILQEHGNDRAYYELFTHLGCITEENFEGILTDISEDYPEMKAFFLRYKEEKIGYTDFFEDLEL